MKRMITQELIDYLASLKGSDLDDIITWAGALMTEISIGTGGIGIDNDVLLSGGCMLQITDLSDIKDGDNVSYFPSLTDQAGKVVKVNDDETGFEYGEVSGGTKLYEHKLSMINGNYSNTITGSKGFSIDNSTGEMTWGTNHTISFVSIIVISTSPDAFSVTDNSIKNKILYINDPILNIVYTQGPNKVTIGTNPSVLIDKIITAGTSSRLAVNSWTDTVTPL